MRRPHLLPLSLIAALALSGCVPSAERIPVEIVAIAADDLPTSEPGAYGSTVLDAFDDLVVLLPDVAPLRDQLAAADQQYGSALLADPVIGVAPDGGQGSSRSDVSTGSALAGSTLIGLVGLGGGSDSLSGLGVGDSVTSDDGTMTVIRGEDNVEIGTTATETVTDSELSVTSEYGAGVEGTVCPDDSGHFDFTVSATSKAVGTSPTETATASQDLTVRISGTLGEDAAVESVTVDGTQDASEVNPAGDQVSVSSRQAYTGGAEAIAGLGTVSPELVSKSSEATSDDVERLAKRGGDRLASMAFSALVAASDLWANGGCVRIVAPTPGSVKPGATAKISVATEGKLSHAKFSAKVGLALSGPKKIDKQKLTSEDSVTWTAGDTGTKATLTLTTKSRRGGATLTVPLIVGGQAYTAVGGGGDFQGSGTICDIAQPFTISGSGVTFEFTPSGPDGGAYSYEGSMSGFAVRGNGTYTVGYADDVAVSITATGPGSVDTPMGTQTATGTEEYTLTPTTSGC